MKLLERSVGKNCIHAAVGVATLAPLNGIGRWLSLGGVL